MRHFPYVCLIILTCAFVWADNDTAYAAPQTFYEFTVSEGEEFTIKFDVNDPDGDELRISFDAPLDAKGKWRTNFTDAGRYESKAHINDGQTTVDVLLTLIVKDVNRPIQDLALDGLDSFQETETGRFVVAFDDKDKENVSVRWFWDGRLAFEENISSYESIFSVPSTYGDKGTHILRVLVSDGKSQVNATKNITITKRNRAPLATLPDKKEFFEGEIVKIEVIASDPDNDTLVINLTPAWQTSYSDAGTYTFVVTVDDSEAILALEYNISIIDVNHLPTIEDLTAKEVREGEDIEIPLVATDADKDPVEIVVSNLPEGALFERGVIHYAPSYSTTYKKAKNFDVLITASDSKNVSNYTLSITVIDVNRPPAFDPYNQWGNEVSVNEGEELVLSPRYADPDGDLVTISYAGWMDARSKKVGYLEQGKHSVLISASDGEFVVTQKLIVKVINTNDPPELKDVPMLHVYEGQTLSHTFTYKDQDDVVIEVDGIPAVLDGSTMHWTPSSKTVSNVSQNFVDKAWDMVVFWRPTGAYREFEAKVSATDALGLRSDKPFRVRVYDRNLAPLVTGITPASQLMVFQNDIVTLSVAAEDESNLSYSWDFGLFDTHEGGSSHTRKFTQLGVHPIELTISDGELETATHWDIEVVPFAPPKKEEPKVEPVVEKKVEKAPEPPKPTGPKVITLT